MGCGSSTAIAKPPIQRAHAFSESKTNHVSFMFMKIIIISLKMERIGLESLWNTIESLRAKEEGERMKRIINNLFETKTTEEVERAVEDHHQYKKSDEMIDLETHVKALNTNCSALENVAQTFDKTCYMSLTLTAPGINATINIRKVNTTEPNVTNNKQMQTIEEFLGPTLKAYEELSDNNHVTNNWVRVAVSTGKMHICYIYMIKDSVVLGEGGQITPQTVIIAGKKRKVYIKRGHKYIRMNGEYLPAGKVKKLFKVSL